MIFLSHNSKDKVLVEPVALKLRQLFGEENVFYDSWSIQPGDGIIDKMNEGLKNCDYFFFFMSKNSLQSYMVKMEWQNAVMKVSKGYVKFIPVRLDDCEVPPILMQNLYIDMYVNGLDISLRQILDVVNHKNIFRERFNNIINLVAEASRSADQKIINVLIKAQYFLEPHPIFAFLTKNEENEIGFKYTDDKIIQKFGFNHDFPVQFNGTHANFNIIRIDASNMLTPQFPCHFEFTAKTDKPINIFGIIHEESENMWKTIPAIGLNIV